MEKTSIVGAQVGEKPPRLALNFDILGAHGLDGRPEPALLDDHALVRWYFRKAEKSPGGGRWIERLREKERVRVYVYVVEIESARASCLALELMKFARL